MTSLWRNRRYATWLVSDTAKGLSNALVGFAIPLLALVVTDDPRQAGVVGAIGLAVRVALMLYGGVLADRHRRVTLMLLGAGVGAVIAAGFTVLAGLDAITFATLLIVQVLLSVRSGLLNSAGESALKEVVPDETMGRAQAANQARDAALQLAGGPIGGVLLVVGGWLVALVMTLCEVVSGVTAALLRRQLPVEPSEPGEQGGQGEPSQRSRNAAREIGEGIRWLFSRTDVRGILVISTIINLGINVAVTTVIYSLQQSGHSPAVIGWVEAGMGGAMLLGAAFAATIVARIGAGVITIAGLTAIALGAAAIGLAHHPIAITAILAVPALLLAPVNAALGGYFMVATPRELIGRASSASGLVGMGAMPLAPLIAGFGLSWLGREATIGIGAALCAVAMILAFSNRSLRSLPAESGWAAHAAKVTL